MTVISNESAADATAAAAQIIDYAAHVLTIERPDYNSGCGDEACCGGPTQRSWCSCGNHSWTASNVDYNLEEHAEHVAEAHGVEQIDEDRLVITYE